MEKLDSLLMAFWNALTGASKPLIVSAAENAIRAESPRFSQRKAFSAGDSTDGYLLFVENGLYRRVTLSEGATTMGPERADYRLADSDGDCLRFVKWDNRYYVQGRDSASGACLNGRRLPPDVMIEIKPHDVIQFAHTTLTFFLPDVAPKRTDADGKEEGRV